MVNYYCKGYCFGEPNCGFEHYSVPIIGLDAQGLSYKAGSGIMAINLNISMSFQFPHFVYCLIMVNVLNRKIQNQRGKHG